MNGMEGPIIFLIINNMCCHDADEEKGLVSRTITKTDVIITKDQNKLFMFGYSILTFSLDPPSPNDSLDPLLSS